MQNQAPLLAEKSQQVRGRYWWETKRGAVCEEKRARGRDEYMSREKNSMHVARIPVRANNRKRPRAEWATNYSDQYLNAGTHWERLRSR